MWTLAWHFPTANFLQLLCKSWARFSGFSFQNSLQLSSVNLWHSSFTQWNPCVFGHFFGDFEVSNITNLHVSASEHPGMVCTLAFNLCQILGAAGAMAASSTGDFLVVWRWTVVGLATLWHLLAPGFALCFAEANNTLQSNRDVQYMTPPCYTSH